MRHTLGRHATGAVFLALAVLSHLGACYEFVNYHGYTRDSRVMDASWALLLALAVIFWVLRARVRNPRDGGES